MMRLSVNWRSWRFMTIPPTKHVNYADPYSSNSMSNSPAWTRVRRITISSTATMNLDYNSLIPTPERLMLSRENPLRPSSLQRINESWRNWPNSVYVLFYRLNLFPWLTIFSFIDSPQWAGSVVASGSKPARFHKLGIGEAEDPKWEAGEWSSVNG